MGKKEGKFEGVIEGIDELEELEIEEEFEDGEEVGQEETDAERAYRRHKRWKTVGIVCGSILGVLVAVYVGFAFYFESHFLFFTQINGTDFSMKNISQVEQHIEKQVEEYVLTLKESDGGEEKIAGKDISLAYVPGSELKTHVKKQNNFLWIKSLWEHPEISVAVNVKYDEDKLTEVTENLDCMKKENQKKSINAHPEFKETQFEVEPEVVGTQIDAKKFEPEVKKALDAFQPELVLADAGCYILPKYVSDSEEVIKATEDMNSYLGAKITYDFNPKTEVVDSKVISEWITYDDKMKVTFHKKSVKKYIEGLAEKYNTQWKSRKFTTATGNIVTVEGGAYGWKIDEEKEYKQLTADIKKGKEVSREPAYSSRAVSHGDMDVGDTYAEVDLTNQKAYFIKDGEVVLSSDVVTGNPNNGNATPQGTYSLTYKTMHAVLRGEKLPDGTYSYESPVTYWMPFNGGIGFHDASWQAAFGGSRYKTHGSHGCINMPIEKAKEMYNCISDGTPVVCHY